MQKNVYALREGAMMHALSRALAFSLDRLSHIPWFLFLMLSLLAVTGVVVLYSAGGGNWLPWALPHLYKFLFSAVVAVIVALFPLRFWLRATYPLYALAILLLLVSELLHIPGTGPSRWLSFGPLQIQPSEFAKLALIAAIAKYFHHLPTSRLHSVRALFMPLAMTLAVVFLVYRQPDLGTAAGLFMTAAVVCFVAGVRWRLFASGIFVFVLGTPFAWSLLEKYQKERILTFLAPEKDSLGSGYQILQSSIAFGSGGLLGKGYLEGTQTHLQFLPENHTDFVFAILAEEWGFVGTLAVWVLFMLVMAYVFRLSFSIKSVFGRLLTLGFVINLFVYVFINIAMVIGVFPVVGMPLPLISYGGSAMLAVMMGAGMVAAARIDSKRRLGHRAEWEPRR